MIPAVIDGLDDPGPRRSQNQQQRNLNDGPDEEARQADGRRSFLHQGFDVTVEKEIPGNKPDEKQYIKRIDHDERHLPKGRIVPRRQYIEYQRDEFGYQQPAEHPIAPDWQDRLEKCE